MPRMALSWENRPIKTSLLLRPVASTLTARAACRGSILETLMASLLAGTTKVHIQWKQTVRELLLSKMIAKSSLATTSTQHKVEASLYLCKLIRVQSLQPISGAEFRNRSKSCVQREGVRHSLGLEPRQFQAKGFDCIHDELVESTA